MYLRMEVIYDMDGGHRRYGWRSWWIWMKAIMDMDIHIMDMEGGQIRFGWRSK